jgi:hypothetical protein
MAGELEDARQAIPHRGCAPCAIVRGPVGFALTNSRMAFFPFPKSLIPVIFILLVDLKKHRTKPDLVR